jgi:thiamine-phosphate pyrophosphorylase
MSRRPRLLLLTDRAQLPPGRSLVDTVAECVEAGAQAIVVRELDLPRPERKHLLDEIAEAVDIEQVQLISARSWFPTAHGVHLSAVQTGLDARPAPFHGRSCHNAEEVRRAVGGGASYLTVSPAAASQSKPGYGPAIGERGVRRATDVAGEVPVYALGGIDRHNAAAMVRAGAYGVAVMGAVMRSDNPAEQCRQLLEEVGT